MSVRRGDDSASASSPTNVQISGPNPDNNQVGVGEDFTELTFIFAVICPPGFDCPSASDFRFVITSSVNVRPSVFSGPFAVIDFSDFGSSPIANYTIFVSGPLPHGLTLRQSISRDCAVSGVNTITGEIGKFEQKTCAIAARFEPPPLQ
jgi:hypothetical protein